MIAEKVGLRGELNVVLLDSQGNVKEQRKIKNLVVSTGLAYISNRIKDATVGVMTHMAVGTNGTAAAGAQSALLTEAGTRAALMTTTIVTTNVTDDSVQFVATFNPNNPVGLTPITEAGLFNAATAGIMLARTTFPVINKDVDDSLIITWKIIQTAA